MMPIVEVRGLRKVFGTGDLRVVTLDAIDLDVNSGELLADEPTASLDTERGFKVMGLMKKIAKERSSAVIVVTHDERMIAGFDTVKRLRDGRFVDDARAMPGQVALGH